MVELAKKPDIFEIASGRCIFNTLDGDQESKFKRLASMVCSAMRDVVRKRLTNTISGGVIGRTGGPKWVKKDNNGNPAVRIQVPRQTNGHGCGVLPVVAIMQCIINVNCGLPATDNWKTHINWNRISLESAMTEINPEETPKFRQDLGAILRRHLTTETSRLNTPSPAHQFSSVPL